MENTEPNPQLWHTLEVNQVIQSFKVDLDIGLTESQVQVLRDQFGPNELVEGGLKSPWRILAEQFAETMVIVLIVAAIISAVIGDLKDAVAILAIVILNAALGFIQEYRAERAMAALKQMAAPVVKIRREGHIREVGSRELVPGDIIFLEAGDAVPADARLFDAANLRVQEASLTGESLPVDKQVQPLKMEQIPVGDRSNMVYMGTAVTYGRGGAVVVETGMRTELGKIAELIQAVGQEQTPLQKRMAGLGRSLALVALIIVAVVFGLGILQGEELTEMFLTAVALAVAAVPEGLPAVVTIALALGAQRMLRRKALIRKLPAVETLGSVTVICSDKTGTLTENRMTVKILDVADHKTEFEQPLRAGQPVLLAAVEQQKPTGTAQALLLAGGALCSDAFLEADDQAKGDFTAVGDPTEGALLVAAARFGLWKANIEAQLPRVGEVPFSSERKRMTTVHELCMQDDCDGFAEHLQAAMLDRPSPYVAFTKGAVDNLLPACDRVWVQGEIKTLSEGWFERIDDSDNQMADDGLRVLGVAYRPLEALPNGGDMETVEEKLIFVGMVGMMDPPRPEVRDSVQTAQFAGIRPVMITGDHPLTAMRIARDLKIAENGSILTGKDLAKMSPEELEARVEDVRVFARVSPEHKLNIVEALQQRGHIVAMTGDGVNDAPALRKSDIGVAMGITGTDVSKEAADMVILDDNFATIVNAIEEGRTIYDNVRKFINYTLTSNAGEIFVMLLAPFLGMPVPLTALQILWINLVTDGLPGLALGVEPPERGVMTRRPYPPKESIFARGLGARILGFGFLMGIVSLGVGYWGWASGNPAWHTMVFTTLTISQMGNALAVRSNRDSLFTIGLLSNPVMLGAVLLTLVLQLMVTYIAPLQAIFNTQALTPAELGISLLASLVVFIGIEIQKAWHRSRK